MARPSVSHPFDAAVPPPEPCVALSPPASMPATLAARPDCRKRFALSDEQTEFSNAAAAAVWIAQNIFGASRAAVHLVVGLPTMPAPGVVPNRVSFDIVPLVSHTSLWR
jgi:hypothetical protein